MSRVSSYVAAAPLNLRGSSSQANGYARVQVGQVWHRDCRLVALCRRLAEQAESDAGEQPFLFLRETGEWGLSSLRVVLL